MIRLRLNDSDTLAADMGKIKKFPSLSVRTIVGGKDPKSIIEEFVLRLGHDPEECQKQKESDFLRWMIPLGGEEELEILLEGLKTQSETTVYMGLNVATIPIRHVSETVITALQIADGLVGIKVSLVGHFLVLSASMPASGMSLEELEYHHRLITAQREWFQAALLSELGWEAMPEE